MLISSFNKPLRITVYFVICIGNVLEKYTFLKGIDFKSMFEWYSRRWTSLF